jgi:hypothetical protein
MIGVKKMGQKFSQWMAGRYGSDQFGRFLAIVSVALLIAGMIVRNTIGTLLIAVAFACLIFSYYRMFSKRVGDRQRENVKYLNIKYKVTGWFGRIKNRWQQSKTFRFYKCPECGVTVRVPRGKGKIRITCPKCRHAFIKNT